MRLRSRSGRALALALCALALVAVSARSQEVPDTAPAELELPVDESEGSPVGTVTAFGRSLFVV
ncbi:hypothetical protein FJZ36_15870 [Candidatus Poribacteria bacterium]|nr:hypothetical protein [Candidatus Poribacteria bacterium]